MTASARLVDWATARRVGSRLTGAGPPLQAIERARLREDFARSVAEAEGLIAEFTELTIEGPPTRPWVMGREEWVAQNLRGFEGLFARIAEHVHERRPGGALAAIRRKTLATQVGGLVAYLGRKVLGQYDLFLPPDDRDLLYFVGPNVVALERRFLLDPREFRLWLALHEVTHRAQFDGVPWLREHFMALVNAYLDRLDLDPRHLLQAVRRAVEEARRGRGPHGLGILVLLMTPEQRELFKRMQAMMSLLEGHGNYVMNALAEGRIPSAQQMRRLLRQRRHGAGVNRMVQRAMGLDAKVRQYDLGERFVGSVVDSAGPEGFGRVWERAENLPSLQEIWRPEAWVERVAAT